MGRLSVFMRWPAARQRLLLEVVLFHAVAGLALWLLPFRSLRPVLTSLRTSAQLSSLEEPVVVSTVLAASRHLPKSSCLTRALVLFWALRRAGISSQVMAGIRLHHEALEAHAWVEHEGRVVGEAADVRASYAPFPNPLFEAEARA
jgi:hypothetical protein